MKVRSPALAIVVVSGVLLACEGKEPQPPLSPPRPAAPSTGAPTTPARSTPTAPAPSSATPASSSVPGQAVNALGVSLTLPDGWKQRPPSNQMRLAEADAPDPGGDPSRSCTVVFSTAGGGVEDNIARWAGQVRDAQGQPARHETVTRTVNGLKVSTVQMTGSYAGMGEGAPKPEWMLRGAIVETSQGLLFIKMTGPAPVMTALDGGFTALIESVKKN